jgi:subtilase family serine protease
MTMKKNPLNSRRSIFLWKLGAIAFVTFGMMVSTSAADEPRVALSEHIPKEIQSAALVERAPADEPVHLSLSVRLDQNLLDQTIAQLYGPNAPENKHFLSSSEFAQRFGLADKRQRLKDFAMANGLSVDPSEDKPGSLAVKVSGSASLVEKAFGIQLNHYRNSDGQVFRAENAVPMIPASLAPHLSGVLGLSNLTHRFRPHIRYASNKATSSRISNGSGPNGGLSPDDIKTIYGLSQTTLTGAGQTVALFELDGYNPADIARYQAQFTLPNLTVTPVLVDNATNVCGSGCDEVTLDIEMVAALAPGATILVYENPQASSYQDEYDIYDKIATDNTAKAVSTSWGYDEQDVNDSDMTFIQMENNVFQQMAIQGQTIYAASADCGAYDQESNPGTCIFNKGFRVDDPASQPFVTGVGGTALNGTVQAYTETTWNELTQPAGYEGATGGGASAVWPIPSYQTLPNVDVTVNGGSSTMRNVPDVALNADPDVSPYSICIYDHCNIFSEDLIGGTSAAAPLWAGLTALLNQQRSSAGKSSFGFANPTLYQLGSNSTSANAFHDVTTGANGLNGAGFKAGAGYDNTTGWGSFNGAVLISTAATINTAFVIPSLNNLYAFPNPWDARNPRDSNRTITFTNGYPPSLPNGTTIKIFTLSGFWVKTLTVAGGQAVWQGLTNDAGERVASGLYFYVASGGGSTVKGTIAIIK